MKVKSYKGRSLDKIYKAVQKDLGPKAVIVSSRKCNDGGLLGIISNSNYELVAVADDSSSDRSLVNNAIGTELFERFTEAQSGQFRRMEQAMRELRAEMRTLKREAPMVVPPSVKPVENLPDFAQGWDPRFVKKMRSHAPNFFNMRQITRQRDALSSQLRIEENFPIKHTGRPHTVVLVGPTGSGKTTTLAKLASRWGMEFGMKVGLITTDTYRVAAVDQIKEYATLLGLDLKVVFGAAEAKAAADSFSDRDIILVDTAGRNHYDQGSLRELRMVLEAMGPFTVLLTLPANINKDQVPELVRNYTVLKPDYLVVTKIDETRKYDILTTARCESTCPIAFYTNGQRVPQDLETATVDKTVKMLLQK